MVELWKITLLGHLRIQRDGSTPITRFRTQKTAALLAYLAFYLNRAHPREELVGRFWPDDDAEAGRSSLRTALAALRRTLEPAPPGAGSILIADRFEVRLDRSAVRVDTVEFESELKAAAKPGATVATEEIIERLTRAQELYAGDLLPGFYEDWILAERERLREMRLDALQKLSRLLTQTGDTNRALLYARRAVSMDPLREEPREAVLETLIAAGQFSSALHQYEEIEDRLKKETGESPGPALRRLAEQARARVGGRFSANGATIHAPKDRTGAAAPEPASSGGSISADAVLSQTREFRPALPLPRTRFFGRETEIAYLIDLLRARQTRLITLTGPGGSGKTRLSIEVALQVGEIFGTVVRFVSLADIPDARVLPEALLEAVGVERPPDPSDPLGPVAEALNRLAQEPGRALLILDNFEHLVGVGPVLVTELLARAPALICLVTSRQRLDVEGEWEFPVESLPVPTHPGGPERLLEFPSVQLFADRARMARPDFALDPANASSVALLCERLEGVPLAIELAAARAGMLTPQQMLDQIRTRFDFLVSRRHDVAPRHRSLRATVGWSYELLSEPLRRFFARLSVFRGGWTLEAAHAICAAEDRLGGLDVLEDLSELRNRSLIIAYPHRDGDPMRYRMLETLREYGQEILSEEESQALRSRHARWYLALAQEADPHLLGDQQAFWMDRLEVEHDNLRAALAWTLEQEPATALRLAAALFRFWEVRAFIREGNDWLERSLGAFGAEATTDPDRLLLADALNKAGKFAWFLRDFARSRTLVEDSLAQYRQLSGSGSPHPGIADPLTQLAGLLTFQNDVVAGRQLLEEALYVADRSNDTRQKMDILERLVQLELVTRDYVSGERDAEEWLHLARDVGDRSRVAAALMMYGINVTNRGEPERARPLFQEAIAVSADLGEKYWRAGSWWGLGLVELLEGNYAEARRCETRSLEILADTGYEFVKHYVLEALAYILAGEGRARRAARLFGAMEHLRSTSQVLIAPLLHDVFASFPQRVREDLPPSVFAEEQALGAQMNLEQALAYAFSETENTAESTAAWQSEK